MRSCFIFCVSVGKPKLLHFLCFCRQTQTEINAHKLLMESPIHTTAGFVEVTPMPRAPFKYQLVMKKERGLAPPLDPEQDGKEAR
jgi:hypothetical protein